MLWLSVRRKKAQLFRCKEATSNAVNAYPMPNRHEVFLLKHASQSVRIRHFSRYKCREPAITAQIVRFLINRIDDKFRQNPIRHGEKLRPNKSRFSRYTVAGERTGNVFCRNKRQVYRRSAATAVHRSSSTLCAYELCASPSSHAWLANLRRSFCLTRPLRRHSMYP